MRASFQGNSYLPIVKLLLKKGGDFSIRDGGGKTALDYAVAKDGCTNSCQVIKLLLDYGAKPHLQSTTMAKFKNNLYPHGITDQESYFEDIEERCASI
jgi:ankyrin repeat protein